MKLTPWMYDAPPRRARPKSRLLGVCGAILIALLSAAPTARAQEGPPPALVRVDTARQEQVRQHRLIVGRVEAARRTTLTAELQGMVIQAPPESGLPVKAGAVVARLDDTLLKINRDVAAADVQEAEALIEDRQAQLDLAVRNREHIERLRTSDVAREKELADAIDQQASARAQLRLAQAQLASRLATVRRLEEQIDRMAVDAPFDGYVVSKLTELGQWISPGDPIVEIVETKTVKVRLDVPQAMVWQIPPDASITLEFEAIGEQREGKLFTIVPDADPQARTFRVLIKLKNPDGALKPGMSVSAMLPTGRQMTALTVPKDAVVTTPAGKTVYVNRGGSAIAVNVSVQFSLGERFVVNGAIRDGEQVVTEGNERLAPGQPLNVLNAEATPSAPDKSS